jgi:hypothetical protein
VHQRHIHFSGVKAVHQYLIWPGHNFDMGVRIARPVLLKRRWQIVEGKVGIEPDAEGAQLV